MNKNEIKMKTLDRRYDIDWVRVIAIGLLLIYHVAIGFQPWGIMIMFITSDKTWGSLWTPMTMLNVWRIPLLFFVSGMGVYFALQNRTWLGLLTERAARILVPYVLGVFVIFPVSMYIWQTYYKFGASYTPNPGHLWFLGNILVYVLIFTPLFYYLKRNENGAVASFIRTVLSNPLGLLVVVAAFVTEALVIDPNPYEVYAMNWHGFFLGLIAFFFGFCFVISGKSFWSMLVKWRWMFLIAAVGLFILRLVEFQQFAPKYMLAIESNMWIFSVLAFANKYLNRPGRALSYLSQAAYPVYILHMIFLYVGSVLIFPLDISAPFQFVLVLLFTFAGCFISYEFLIRRVNVIRVLFGLKMKERKLEREELNVPEVSN